MTKLSNLQIIERAAEMGYAAKFLVEEKEFLVVSFYRNQIGVRWPNGMADTFTFEDAKITSYLYVGHLFGEPVIPEGQRFRLKETGEVLTFFRTRGGGFHLEMNESGDVWHKEEVEPVFD